MPMFRAGIADPAPRRRAAKAIEAGTRCAYGVAGPEPRNVDELGPRRSRAAVSMTQACAIAVFAHDEADTIVACLDSVYAGGPPRPFSVHVLANGCRDGTEAVVARYARAHPEVRLHVIALGDKSNAWNAYVHELAPAARVHCFVDGDVRVRRGALGALARALPSDGALNGAASLPEGGRHARQFAREITAGHALPGNLYALAGHFVARIRTRGLRLPVGLIGDDSWVGALALMDLEAADWSPARVTVCAEARFAYEPLQWHRPAHVQLYLRRRLRYALRTWQTVMLRGYVAEHGLARLPAHVRELYRDYFHLCRMQWAGNDTLFLWLARQRIRAARDGACAG
jgi:glycosyltransferase involved in cell wall biosynthesis